MFNMSNPWLTFKLLLSRVKLFLSILNLLTPPRSITSELTTKVWKYWLSFWVIESQKDQF